MKLSHHKKLETKKLSNIEKITPVIWEYNSCIILQQFWLNCSHFVIQKRHKITIGNFQIFSSLLSIFLVKHKKFKFVFLTFAQETICEKEIWIFFCTLNRYIGLIPKIIINKIQNVLKIMLTSPKLSECISAIYTQILFNNAHNQFFIQNSFCKFNNPNVFFLFVNLFLGDKLRFFKYSASITLLDFLWMNFWRFWPHNRWENVSLTSYFIKSYFYELLFEIIRKILKQFNA